MKQAVKLEVDPSIIERNLLFTERVPSPIGDNFDVISRLLGQPTEDVPKPDDVPCVVVRPTAGFCVKTWTTEGDKVFINVCHSSQIPPPPDVSDEELIQILESDEASFFTVPMSLGALHIEADKGGNVCSVYDVAINTSFFEKLVTNQLFKTFMMTIILEGLENKYNLSLTLREKKPYVVLKNRKQIGTLQSHRVEKRGAIKPEETKKLIEVLSSSEELQALCDVKNVPRPVTVSLKHGGKPAISVDENNRLRLFIVGPKNGEPVLMLVLVKVKALTGSDVNVDASSRRLVISCERNETVDCVLPYPVQADKAVAEYFVNLQVLKIFLPLDDSHVKNLQNASADDLVETELIGESKMENSVRVHKFPLKSTV